MILRHLALRHGRRALAKSPIGSCRRALATQVETVQNPYEGSIDAQRQIKSGVDEHKSAAVPALNAQRQSDAGAQDQVARDYFAFEQHKALTQRFGGDIEPYYQPHTLLANPPSPSDITLELLLASQSHLGHATGLWNPANSRYIFGVRDGIHIISLDVTASHLRRACAIVRGVTERGGIVLFVGTRKGHDRAIVKAAELAGGCHLFDHWTPGSITNGQQILGECRVKVLDEMDREVGGFEEQLSGQGVLKPDLVVCMNPLENYVLLHECGLNNIPTIGVIDTDANPTWVTYPIPANDDSVRCIQVIAGTLGRAGQEGQARRLAQAKKGRRTYRRTHSLLVPAIDETAEAPGERADPEAVAARRQTAMDRARVLTSVSPQGPQTAQDDVMEEKMKDIFEMASFSDFEDPAPFEMLDELMQSEQSESTDLAELQGMMRDARSAAGLAPDAGSMTTIQRLSPAAGQMLEQRVRSMMTRRLTSAELASVEAEPDGDSVRRRIRWADLIKRRQGAEDPYLARLVAQKRKQMGEELSGKDEAILQKLKQQSEAVSTTISSTASRFEKFEKAEEQRRRDAEQRARASTPRSGRDNAQQRKPRGRNEYKGDTRGSKV